MKLPMQAKNSGSAADIGCASAQIIVKQEETFVENIENVEKSSNAPTLMRLSPRLEMRLALNHDIMDDEDLINFDPGPINLGAILGRDLSSYHRFTGRDLISRSASRVVPKEALISFSQQKNSKMDTPTPNRKAINQNTWNNSGYVAESKFKKTKKRGIQFFVFNCKIFFVVFRKQSKRSRALSQTREKLLRISDEEWTSKSRAAKK